MMMKRYGYNHHCLIKEVPQQFHLNLKYICVCGRKDVYYVMDCFVIVTLNFKRVLVPLYPKPIKKIIIHIFISHHKLIKI